VTKSPFDLPSSEKCSSRESLKIRYTEIFFVKFKSTACIELKQTQLVTRQEHRADVCLQFPGCHGSYVVIS
jgi:hypothetical protein